MREVVMLERGVALDVVIRKVTRPFWQACINAVDPPQSDGGRVVAPNQQLRVCAVGTPGIGKTTCTPYLIKMLLEKKKTVVYRVRSEDKDEWIYEFVPGPDGRVTANVYPELAFKSGIQSLKDPSTFYVVDPGDTTDTCNPSPRFRPKVIIVASPDSKHWGANQFTKKRAGLKGVIKVYPVWELDELLIARPYLGSAMTDDQVQDRYRHVGGVPRHVFDDDDASYNDIISQQSLAANKLNGEQAQLLGTVKLQSLTTFDKKQPESSLIGFRVPSDAEFSKYTIDFIAPRVGMSLYRRFMKEMWDKLLLPRAGNPWIFEAYTRYLLGTNRTSTFQRRGGVGKRDFQRGKVQSVSLGGCGEIRSTWDIVAAAKERPMVLFHPIKPTENLIDFIYQDSTQHFHAFQVTLSEKHSAPADDIRKLEQSVGNPRALSLYYLVPEFRFASFVTDPVDPRNPGRGKARATCNIYHVAIPDPNSVKDYEPI